MSDIPTVKVSVTKTKKGKIKFKISYQGETISTYTRNLDVLVELLKIYKTDSSNIRKLEKILYNKKVRTTIDLRKDLGAKVTLLLISTSRLKSKSKAKATESAIISLEENVIDCLFNKLLQLNSMNKQKVYKVGKALRDLVGIK